MEFGTALLAAMVSGMVQMMEKSSQYTSWLKQRMLQKESGMDDEELNWEFRVFTKEVENSYVCAGKGA